MAWAAASIAGIIALIACAAILTERRRLRGLREELHRVLTETSVLKAALSGGRSGAYFWPRDGSSETATPGIAALLDLSPNSRVRFADIMQAMRFQSAARLKEAVSRLRDVGTAFSITIETAEKRRTLRAIGRRVTDAEGRERDGLWLYDETDHVRKVTALEVEALQLRALLDALPIPLWCRDENLDIVDCNLTYALAVEAESPKTAVIEGREIAAGAKEGVGRTLAERSRATHTAQSESHHIVIEGSRRLLELTEAPMKIAGRMAGFAMDYTEIENVQAELARVVASQDEVLENLATAIVIFGPDKRLKFFNSAYANLWNLEGSWLRTGPEIGEIMEALRERRLLPEHPDFPAFKGERMKLFTSLIEPMEELVHQPNGTTLRMVISPYPMGGLIYTFEDVTDRLALERSYNTLIDVQRETLNNLQEAIAVYGGDGRLKLSNPVFGTMWNLTEDFLNSEPHISAVLEATQPFFHEDANWPELKERVIARTTAREFTKGYLDRADDTVIEYVIVPLPDGGALVSHMDVSDSIRVERVLRERNEALETADRLKSEFIANVSYELRTPLNTIIGFTEILNNEYFGPLSGRQKEYTEGVLDSSTRLLALINDLLDLATIEAGRMRLDIESIRTRELLDSVVNLTREWAQEQDLQVEIKCPANIGAFEADERRLKHALFNLVSNAIKFTPPQGAVVLEAKRKGDQMVLSVSDTGIGISQEDQQRIFEKFVRGKRPDGRSVGAGLGLSLVKSIVELHGGRIDMESRPSQGTTISCYLPKRQSAAALAAVQESAPEPALAAGSDAAE